MSKHLTDEDLGRLATAHSRGRFAEAADGERSLDAAVRHLAACRSCRQRLDDLLAVRGLLGALPPPDVPPDVFAGIRARVHQQSSSARHRSKSRRVVARCSGWAHRLQPRHLGAVALLALIGGVISVTVRGSHGAGTEPTAESAATPRTTPTATSTAAHPGNVPTTARHRAAVTIGVANAPLVVSWGRDYHHATLTQGADTLLAAVAHPDGSIPTDPLANVVPTAACLRRLGTQLSDEPADSLTLVAVEAARYDARPASVLVLTDPTDPGTGVVLAVAGRCTTEPHLLDEMTLSP